MSWFAFPAGLLALLGLPAVLILHLYRSRHRRQPVSALFLWTDPESETTAGRRRMPLRRTPSFWLEMLCALLAALFIAGFNPLNNAEARHLVVVLDDSASMAAEGSDQRSTVDRIKERLDQAFDDYGRRLRVTLVRSGVRPDLFCGPGALLGEARQALRDWRPRSPGHDPLPALMLATEIAGGGVVWFMTDALPEEGSLPAESIAVHAMGQPLANFALTHARRLPDKKKGQELLECGVLYAGEEASTTTLKVLVRGQEVASESVNFSEAGQRSYRFPLPAGTPTVRLVLAKDALAIDNEAVLHPTPDRTVHVGVAIDEAVADALRLGELIEALPGVQATTAAVEADLVVGHEAAAGEIWNLVLPEATSDAPLEAFVRNFLPEKRHPLLDGVTLDGVVWTRRADWPMPGRPLMTVGDLPLLSMQVQGDRVRCSLNLVPQRSTLSMSPDWPILFSNLIEMCRSTLPGPQAVNLVAGESFEFRRRAVAAAAAGDSTEIEAPSPALRLVGEDQEWNLSGNRIVVEGLAPFANYRLLDGDHELTRFAVNFVDAGESDLSGCHSGERPPLMGETEPAQQRYAESGFGRFLLLALVAAMLLDWWILGGGRPR